MSDGLTWKTIKNTVSERMVDGSLTHTFQDTRKIQKRTKLLNRELRKYSGLKSYRQYVEIKNAILKKSSMDEESDYEPSFSDNVSTANRRNLNLSAYSSDEDFENNQHEDLLISGNSRWFWPEREDENSRKKKELSKSKSKKRNSGTSKQNLKNSVDKSAEPSPFRESAIRNSKCAQSKLTDFLESKSISNLQENSLQEEQQNAKENESSEKIEVPLKTWVSPPKASKSKPSSNNKTSGTKRNFESEIPKPRSKTREDIKKNLSSIINDSELENTVEENFDKNKLSDSHDDLELNLSNLMAVAQSTRYPDDSLNVSVQSEKKRILNDFLMTKNKSQPRDSGIDDDSAEESAKTKGKLKQLMEDTFTESPLKQKDESISDSNNIDNSLFGDEILCDKSEGNVPQNRSSSENKTLQNVQNEFVHNVSDHKEKHVLKIIGSEILNKRYKILDKEQENSKISDDGINGEEEEDRGNENSDELESLNWKLEESNENEKESEKKEEIRGKETGRKVKDVEQSEEINIITEEIVPRNKSDLGKSVKKKELEIPKKNKRQNERKIKNLNDKEGSDDLEKIETFIISKSIHKKARTPKKGKKAEKQMTRELGKSKGSNSEEENGKEYISKHEKNRKDIERILDSSGDAKSEEQKGEKPQSQKQNQKENKVEERRKLTIENKNSVSSEEELEDEKQQEIKRNEMQQQNKVEERRKLTTENKDFTSGEEESEDKSQDEVKRKKEDSSSSEKETEGENQQQNKIEERRNLILGNKNSTSSGEESGDEKQQQKKIEEKRRLTFENKFSTSDEEESEDEKQDKVKRKEIQQQHKIEERKTFFIEKKKEDSNNSEEKKENNVTKFGSDIENNDLFDSDDSFEEDRLFIDENRKEESSSEEEEKEEDGTKDQKLDEEEILTTENTNTDKNENRDSSEEDNSRELLTQFVYHKEDSNSTEEKQAEEDMRLTLENEESEENFVNLDDNKLTFEEHKIEIPENLKMDQEDEEIMSAQSMKRVRQMKRLDLTLVSDSSSSDEEFTQEQINKDKKFVTKAKSDSSDSDDSEIDVKKKSHEKKEKEKSPEKKDLKEKSPKKKKLNRKDSLKSTEPGEKIVSGDAIESSDTSEIETLKNNNSKKGEENPEDDFKITEKEKSEERVLPVEEDSDFGNYIQEGIAFLEQQEEEGDVNLKKKKKSKTRRNSKDFDKERRSSNSQIIEEIQTQNLDSSQIISDPDTQVCLEIESRKSSKSKKKEIEADSLQYVLSSLEKKVNRHNRKIENQTVDKIPDLNKSEDVTEDCKIMTQLEELIEKENLIENNLPSTITVNDISDNEEVWLFEIPKKEISTDLVGKKMSFNGTELKLNGNTYQTSYRKLNTMTCVFSSEKTKRPYETVNIRPVGSVLVRPKNVLNNFSVEDESTNKKKKLTNNQNSSINDSNADLNPETDNEKKKKKKIKLFTQESSLETESNKSMDNKPESTGKQTKSVKHGQKRKRSHLLSENEEDEKMKPKLDIKRKKIWDVNEFALDEKPSIISPENLSHKIYKRLTFGSDSSGVEITDGERKPKKEKREKREKSPLKTKSLKNSESPIRKEEKYNSLDVSKVKVKENKEQVDSDSSTINQKVKKKKKLDNWKFESHSDLEQEEEKLKPEIAIQPEKKKKKKKFSKDSEESNIPSSELKVDKKEDVENSENIFKLSKTNHKSSRKFLSLHQEDSSSEFEIKDTKKLKRKYRRLEDSSILENLQNEEDIKLEKERAHKKVNKFVDFDY